MNVTQVPISATHWLIGEPETDFEEDVERAIRTIPNGKAASYEWVAVQAGYTTGHARAVGNLMQLGPSWRVVRKDGSLNWPYGREVQFALLHGDGVRLLPNGKVDPRDLLV